MSNRRKPFKLLKNQLKELNKYGHRGMSVSDLIIILDILETHGTTDCYGSAISRRTGEGAENVSRKITLMENEKKLITSECKFKNDINKYIELTEKGDYLLARLKRLQHLDKQDNE